MEREREVEAGLMVVGVRQNAVEQFRDGAGAGRLAGQRQLKPGPLPPPAEPAMAAGAAASRPSAWSVWPRARWARTSPP